MKVIIALLIVVPWSLLIALIVAGYRLAKRDRRAVVTRPTEYHYPYLDRRTGTVHGLPPNTTVTFSYDDAKAGLEPVDADHIIKIGRA